MPALEDHELACLFPLMPDDELAALADDIEANGLREPLWLYEGKILDGRNRYRACVLKDIDQRVEHYRGKDPLGFVVSKNLHRRHLTESQRAMVAARLANLRAPKVGSCKAVADSAESLSVSERLVDAARTVVESGVPELAEAVDKGEAAASAAAEVAKLPKAEQRKAVKAGKVKETAAKVRKAKKGEPIGETGEQATPENPADALISRINKLCKAIDDCKAEAEAIGAEPFGRHVHVESVTYSLAAARKALWQARPTEPCNCVKGDKPPAAACKACFGTGLTTAARVLKGGR
jgi:hypothetical protein